MIYSEWALSLIVRGRYLKVEIIEVINWDVSTIINFIFFTEIINREKWLRFLDPYFDVVFRIWKNFAFFAIFFKFFNIKIIVVNLLKVQKVVLVHQDESIDVGILAIGRIEVLIVVVVFSNQSRVSTQSKDATKASFVFKLAGSVHLNLKGKLFPRWYRLVSCHESDLGI